MAHVTLEEHPGIALIRFTRPEKLNALSSELFAELNPLLAAAEANDDVNVIVITGSGRAFAAGADIAEMSAVEDYATVLNKDMVKTWEDVSRCRKPVIAAVNGFALGGGCELAMMCDIIYAAESAKFSQPEIKLGTIPGIGGTQRLTRAVGKSKAMELCLSGRMLTAREAEAAGLVARVVGDDELETEALKLAAEIAAQSAPVAQLVKEAVNTAFENTLKQGIAHERRLFYSTFSLADRKEGMTAFVEKRPPEFKNK